MFNKIRPFFLNSKTSDSESEKLLDQFFSKFFDSMKKMLNVDVGNYGNIKEMLNLIDKKEYNYFWEWFRKKGLVKINDILYKNISDSDDILDLLDYRILILELDIDNNNFDSIIESFIDSIDNIYLELKQSNNDYHYLQISKQKLDILYENSIEKHTEWKIYEKPLNSSGFSVIINLKY